MAAIVVPNVWCRSGKRSRPSPARAGRLDEAAVHCRRVHERAGYAREDEVVVGRPALALTEPGERGNDVWGYRHRAPFAALGAREVALAEACRNADRRVGEVDVAPAQRDELAAAQAGECRGEEDRCVLIVGRGVTNASTSSGE